MSAGKTREVILQQINAGRELMLNLRMPVQNKAQLVCLKSHAGRELMMDLKK